MFEIKHIHPAKQFKRLHGIYHGIKKRCYNANSPRYKDYGGRGIKMSDEWLDSDTGFDAFVDWSLENGYTDSMTIERIDVNGDYCKENCKWITIEEQRKNKRDTLWVEYKGEKVRLQDLCESVAIVSYDTVHDRIFKRGWDLERALTEPSHALRKSLSQKSREHGLDPRLVRDRMSKLGWSEEDALNTPNAGLGANGKTYKHTVLCGNSEKNT